MLVPSFKNHPLGDLQLVPQLLQYNAQHSPDHLWFVLGSSPNDLKAITWAEAGNAFKRAAQLVHSHLKAAPQEHREPPVIGILGNIGTWDTRSVPKYVAKPSNPTDTITYHTLYSGILTAGATAFLISTRNSPAAVAHLLKETGTSMLLVSTDDVIQGLAASALECAQKTGHTVDLISAPTFRELFSKDVERKGQLDYPNHGPDSPAIILHSSGSTSFPKPTSYSHRLIIQWAKLTRISGVELSRQRISVHALPVFHGMGFCVGPWAACTGLTMAAFSPESHRAIPSPEELLDAAVASRSTFMMCVPAFIELWSSSTDDVSKLKMFDGVVFGGGPLNKTIGNELEKAGVSLMCRYGATEIGPGTVLMETKRARADREWHWLKISPDIKIALLPQEGDPELFELVYLKTATYSPAVTNYEVEGTRAFTTRDLVIRHPTDPTKFHIYGRKDDQIMLSTGEKTNPGPMCVIVCKDPLVDFAVMFGRGRPHNGIIVQPTKDHQIDSKDQVALAQFKDAIWPSVEKANAFAPSHSRLSKEMILIAHPSKPFEMTAKRNPRIPVVVEAYKAEIEAAYEAAEAASQTGIAPPNGWTPSEVHEFARKVVYKAMDQEVADNVDIFQYGGDSVQATYIRNAIVHAVRQNNPEFTGRISHGFVYTNPSISGLAAQLLAIVSPGSPNIDPGSGKLKELAELVSEFSVDFPKHHMSMAESPYPGEVVLLTGSTGGLGTQLLAHLASMPTVSHVYALNRKASDGKSSRERQVKALAERGLDVSIVDSPRVTFVEGDTAVGDFGMDRTRIEAIRDSITLIIHNAWRVNFNLALGSFIPMIRGVRNLVDLALQSPLAAPPRLIFTGSVGVFRNWQGPNRPIETRIEDPNLVIGSGYSESKWVGERILEEAAKVTPLRPVIVRIGQMTSNSSGAWASTGWLPAIIRSGQVLGMLPTREEPVSWISMETAAGAIIDFASGDAQYLHLAHPNPIPWNTALGAFASRLKVPLVSWEEWLANLREDTTKPDKNPAALLLDFFRESPRTGMVNREGHGMPALDLQEALKVSPTLADPLLPRVGQTDIERWVEFWTRQGLLTPMDRAAVARL